MDRGPVEIPVEVPPLIERQMIGILNIWDELGAFGVHHRMKLSANSIRRCFELIEPWKELPRMEFALAEFREVEVRRRAVEGPRLAQDVASKALDPFARRGVCECFAPRHCGLHLRLARSNPFGVAPFSMCDNRRDLRREFAGRPVCERLLPRFWCPGFAKR